MTFPTYVMSDLLTRFTAETARYESDVDRRIADLCDDSRPLHLLISAAHSFFAVGSPYDFAHKSEPLSGYGLTYDELAWVTQQAMPVDVADEFI